MLLEVVGWINLIFWGSAESPGGTALATLCCRARRVVRLGGKAPRSQNFLPSACFRGDGSETSVSSFSLNN